MSLARVAVILCLSVAPAAGQSSPNFSENPLCANTATCVNKGGNPGLNQAFQSKADVLANGIVPTAPPYLCIGDGVVDDTPCMQSALNDAAAKGVPLLVGWNNTKYSVSALSSNGIVDIEGFAPVGNEGNGGNQTCVNGLFARSNVDLLTLTGSKVAIHNLCIQMGTPGVGRTGGAAILLGGADQGHDDITGNTIFWPYDGIQVGRDGGLVRASNISQNVIRSPAHYGIAIGQGTTGGLTAGITMRDNQIGCDVGVAGVGLAIFDGAVTVDGTTNGPNNCAYGTAIIPGNLQNVGGQFTGVMGDSDSVNDLLIAPTETGGVLFGGTVNFLEFDNAWAAAATPRSVPSTISVLVNCPANTLCSQILFNGLTAHGSDQQTAPIVDFERGAGGPISLTLSNSQICSFGAAGAGEVALRLNSPIANQSALWIINNNRIGESCGSAGFTATPIGISISTAGGSSSGWMTITGNQISESATPIQYVPTGNENMNIVNNLGVDNFCPNVMSAASISIPNAATCVHITGGTGISSITNSAWITRTVRLISDSGTVLSTGGTPPFCTGITLTAHQQVFLVWDNEDGCWQHTP
jgi:hypothetical protein